MINFHQVRSLSVIGDTLRLKCPPWEKDAAKSIIGWRWNQEAKCWEYPLKWDVFEAIRSHFPTVYTPAEVERAAMQAAMREAEAMDIKRQGWEKAEPVEPMPLKTNPFRHQVAGYNMGLHLRHLALFMEQGCGKSLTAIAIAGRRFQHGEISRVLIVAPASVVGVWPREFEDHADFSHDVRPLEGDVKKRVSMLEGWKRVPGVLQVAVVNYEATWRMEEALTAWQPDMIICDEAQRIKSPGAQQSKAMHRIARIAKYRLILTGTPVCNSPLDLFSMYKFLDSSIFGTSFYPFRNHYAIMGGFNQKQVVGYKRLPELIRKAHKVAFRVTKEEALDLPEFVDQVLYCELEPAARKIYDGVAKESIAELEGEQIITAANVLARLLRLSQVSGGFVNDDDHKLHQVSNAKLKLLEETLDDLLAADKKVVVFVRFLPEMAAIESMLMEKEIGYARIAGDVSMADRTEEVKRFQTDPNCKVFVAQIQSAGLGITLTAADTAIFYSMDFSFANYDQARARIHRLGQRNKCTYIHLITNGTVDEKILAALKEKRNIADQIVDDWRNYF